MNLHPYFFRMAVRSEYSQEDFERFFYFERIYHSIGGVVPGQDEYINYENIYSDANENISIKYRDDGLLDMNWVQVSYLGSRSVEAERAFQNIVVRLKEKVPTYEIDELLKMYYSAPEEEDGQRLFAVYATAVGAPWEYSKAHFDAMNEYAQDAKATVRSGVIIGIGYIGQTEYETILKKLVSDENDDVAQRARRMLNDFTELREALKE